MNQTTVAIIGAGPAGLTAAYLLSKQGIDVAVLETDPTYVGGISRTVNYKGYLFDIGGHRFFSKSKAVSNLWEEILPGDFLSRPRSSRIYYKNKFFQYPLAPINAFSGLGLLESLHCVVSWLKARVRPARNPQNFEEWVSNQFGKRLFKIFFKSYTEKVWGMKCSEISADWAAQRIKGLSLGIAIKHAFFSRVRSGAKRDSVKSLIGTFSYPRRGPGMMWEACAHKVQSNGGRILLGQTVSKCSYASASGRWTLWTKSTTGEETCLEADEVISSAPLRELALSISPSLPPALVQLSNALRYRDFIMVALILKDQRRFSDNWIYIHDPSVKVGRIQNFKSWSPEMVPDESMCCYGMEYFCFEGDGLWTSEDQELIELAKCELEKIGLALATDIVDGCVVRQKKAYPVYDDNYAEHVEQLRREFEVRFPTLHLVGRNGMHKYNNQDHAMMTAMLCVDNIVAGQRIHDLWKVNQDAEYHEGGEVSLSTRGESGLRMVPARVPSLDKVPAARSV